MSGEITLIALESAQRAGSRVNQILSEWRGGEVRLIPAECPSLFQRGGKVRPQGIRTGPGCFHSGGRVQLVAEISDARYRKPHVAG